MSLIRNPDIPSMGGNEIADALFALARQAHRDHHIVEFGSWLGAGTWALAQAVVDTQSPLVNGRPRLHVYDRFKLSVAGKAKAAKAGLKMRSHQDTLPIVQRFLAPTGVPVKWHKGSILDKVWPADWPIGLYVDDAAKIEPLFTHVLHTFAPAWVPGETLLVLMDFNHWKDVDDPEEKARFRWQSDLVAAHPDSFEPLEGFDTAGTSTAFFRYGAPLDLSRIPATPPTFRQRWRRRRHQAEFLRG